MQKLCISKIYFTHYFTLDLDIQKPFKKEILGDLFNTVLWKYNYRNHRLSSGQKVLPFTFDPFGVKRHVKTKPGYKFPPPTHMNNSMMINCLDFGLGSSLN